MSLNSTASGERLHIGFFGQRNAGKSSLVNELTGQEISVVSETPGTTTDPVRKAMELLPLGPVLIIDTPGFDDSGELGEQRVAQTRKVIEETDVAVLVIDSTANISPMDVKMMQIFKEKKIPFITVMTKADKVIDLGVGAVSESMISVSVRDGRNMEQLKINLAKLGQRILLEPRQELIADLIEPGSLVLLVTPIDESAPKGRMILPQQQTLRAILDAGSFAVVTRETELEETLRVLGRKPDLVVTDSQVFSMVAEIVPEDVEITSFSILFARYKGDLEANILGAAKIPELTPDDRILISEGCTHHRQCADIGTVKLPGWINQAAGCQVPFDTTSGGEFPEDLTPYSLVVHCGACMLNEREMQSRLERARQQGVPMTNYGVAIAQMTGILERSLKPFGGKY